MSNFGTLRDGIFPYSKGFKTSYTIGKKVRMVIIERNGMSVLIQTLSKLLVL